MNDSATQAPAPHVSLAQPSDLPNRPLFETGSLPRGVVVELANVAYDATGWARHLWRLVSHMGLRCDYAEFQRTWSREFLVDVHRGRREHDEALEAFLQARGLPWGEIDEVVAASRGFDVWASDGRPLPGVVKTLASLAARDVAVVIWADSQFPGSRLARQLEADGFAPSIRCLSSFDIEAVQPAESCFRACLEALNLSARQVMYVGHDTRNLAAARLHGLATAAVHFEPRTHADFILGRFEDLLTVVVPPTRTRRALPGCERAHSD